MKKPLISVIIPVYNSKKFLRKCLNSIINQTLKNIEIICINDNSNDSSLKILKDYQKKDRRIKVFNQKMNRGQGFCRNLGLRIAKGEYISFIDSDDWINKTYLERLYKTAKKKNAEVVICSMFNEKTNKYYYFFKEKKVYYNIKEKIKISQIEKRGSVCNVLFSKKLLKKNHLFFEEGVFYEDILFMLKAVYFCNKIVTVPKATYYYRYNPSSTINTLNEKKIEDLYNARKKMKEFSKRYKFRLIFRIHGSIPVPFFILKLFTLLRLMYLKHKFKN
ncbi:MAG: glycosyltransferase family 2 protein [Candidatus Pacearchaeota archaeon]